jgi:hypothetical protein
VVQSGLGCDVARRETGLAGSLEALAARGTGFVSLLLGALKRGLEAPRLGSGLLLVGGVRDCGQPTSCSRYRAVEPLRAVALGGKCDPDVTTTRRNARESPGAPRNASPDRSRRSGSTKGKGRQWPALLPMRPTRIELATFGLKDRRSLDPVKGPLTTELRAPRP